MVFVHLFLFLSPSSVVSMMHACSLADRTSKSFAAFLKQKDQDVGFR